MYKKNAAVGGNRDKKGHFLQCSKGQTGQPVVQRRIPTGQNLRGQKRESRQLCLIFIPDMAIRKQSLLDQRLRAGKPEQVRPYKWAPGIPSKAIEFNDPGTKTQERIDVLGYEDTVAITTETGFIIGITLDK